MQPNWTIVAQISAPLIALFVGAAINRIIEKRPKLVAFFGYVSSHDLKEKEPGQERVILHTHSVVVRNNGKLAAKNVRIGHVRLPESIDVVPAVPHSFEKLADGSVDLVIPTMVPGEQITISYLYFPPVTFAQINSHIKSDEGYARIINVLSVRAYPTWVNRTLAALLVAGAGFLVYLLVCGIIALAV